MASELGHLSATIGLNIEGFLHNITTVKASTRQLDRSLKTLENSYKQFGNSSTLQNWANTQKLQLQQLNTMYEHTAQSAKELAGSINQSLANGKKPNSSQINGLMQQYTQAQVYQNRLQTLARQYAQTQQQIALNNNNVYKSGQYLTQSGNQLTQIGDKIKGMGSAIPFTLISGAMYNAGKSAMTFKSQIQAIAPLLSETGTITATVKRQIDKMAQASLNLSKTYGVSTTEINTAMAELARRGFTANQVLGSMKPILQGSIASGESLEVVMQATASTMEQFGMKARTAREQTANTRKAIDILTAGANKTASSFADISIALQYVGPLARVGGVSLSQTVATIGLLSNRGIEASKAGTILRNVLTALTNSSSKTSGAMAKLGIDVNDIKKHGIDLPKVIEQISKATEHMTKPERMSAFAKAFGKYGSAFATMLEASQKGGKNGAKELRELQSELEKAGGLTARQAKSMSNTPERQWARFKQTVHALGVEIGTGILPIMKTFANGVEGVAKWFDSLDSGAKGAITNFTTMLALVKPVTSLLGGAFKLTGGITKGFGNSFINHAEKTHPLENYLPKGLSGLDQSKNNQIQSILNSAITGASGDTSGIEKLNSSLKETSSVAGNASKALELTGNGATKAGAGANKASGHFSSLKSKLTGFLGGASQTNSALQTTGSAMEQLGTKASGSSKLLGAFKGAIGGFGSTLGSMALGLGANIAMFALVSAGVWGIQKVIDAIHADNARKQGEAFRQGILDNFELAKQGADADGKAIQKAFKDTITQLEKDQDNFDKNTRKKINMYKKFGLDKEAKDEENHKKKKDKEYKDAIKQSKQNEKTANAINKSYKAGKLDTADRQVALNNLLKTEEKAINLTSSLSKKQRKTYEEIITGTSKSAKLSDSAFNKLTDSAIGAFNKRKDQYQKLRKEMDDNGISGKQQQRALNDYAKQTMHSLSPMLSNYARVLKAQDGLKSKQEVLNALAGKFGYNSNNANVNITNLASSLGLSVSQLEKMVNLSGKVKENTKSMLANTNFNVGDKLGDGTRVTKSNSKEITDARNKWNSLVFDTKTMTLRTNAKDVLNQVGDTKKGWDTLQFIDKTAHLNTNQRDFLYQVMSVSTVWNSMTLEEKIASAKTQGGRDLLDQINKMHEWNNVPESIKVAIAQSKGKKDLTALMGGMKEFNKLPEPVKQAIAKASGYNDVKSFTKAMHGANQTRNVDRHATAKVAGTEMAKAFIKEMNKASQTHDVFRTIQTTYRKITETVSNWFSGGSGSSHKSKGKKRKNKTGSSNYASLQGILGYDAIVGDGMRNEVVLNRKTGKLWITPNRPTPVHLDEGDIVFPSIARFKQIMKRHGINLYENGTPNYATDLVNFTQNTKSMQAQQPQQVPTDNQQAQLQAQTNELIATLIEQQAQLQETIKGLSLSLNVDGRKLAKTQAQNNSKAINDYLKQVGMRLS